MKKRPHIFPPPPTATYRFQLHRGFPFKKAQALAPYLSGLGIGAVYASPIFQARSGSGHGYDVTHHGRLNSEIGDEKSFDEFSGSLKAAGLGLVLDVVPNHMCITDPSNEWWQDVLENGPSSPYAKFFDINWRPIKEFLKNKVLLPFLGDQYGKVLENGEIVVHYDEGAFHARYYGLRVPIAPKSTTLILTDVIKRLPSNASASLRSELETMISQLDQLSPRSETNPERVKNRYAEKNRLKELLFQLEKENPPLQSALTASLKDLNGKKGDPRSFDRLEALLDEQAYRLSFWRVAADEINYRRFFDINELAAIRVEEPEVFDRVHSLVKKFIQEKKITGLRIDHVDGLYNPDQYLKDLQALAGNSKNTSFYVVVEKILEASEKLREEWKASGTTGYDFMTVLNGLYVNPAHKGAFLKIYQRFAGQKGPFYPLLVDSKKLITQVSNASELFMLAARLDRISEQHRFSRDFTLSSLRHGLREIVSCFPVYRSYIQSGHVIHPEDKEMILAAVRAAKKRNPATNPSLFDFIANVLLRKDPPGLNPSQKEERREFTMKFQQLTGPIMAKGLEDTGFYRYFPLASLNEVGGYPERFGVTVHEFHARNKERLEKWPDTLLATTTHDTKRSEDVRARLNALSEIPGIWYRALRRWALWNDRFKTKLEDGPAPDKNEEYLIYQTLIGTWPVSPLNPKGLKEYTRRIEEYMTKALREGKVHSSWINPNHPYENAVHRFIRSVLKPGRKNFFEKDIRSSIRPIIEAGRANSLSQTFLKMTVPGVPDFYQGTEFLTFTLVDPDNRRPVNYAALKKALKENGRVPLRQSPKWIKTLSRSPIRGRIKFFITHRTLQFRKKNPALFSRGAYIPLKVTGPKKKHVVAFLREEGGKTAIAVSGRFFMEIRNSDGRGFRTAAMKKTRILLPKKFRSGRYRNIFTGEEVKGASPIPISALLGHLPIALLESL